MCCKSTIEPKAPFVYAQRKIKINFKRDVESEKIIYLSVTTIYPSSLFFPSKKMRLAMSRSGTLCIKNYCVILSVSSPNKTFYMTLLR